MFKINLDKIYGFEEFEKEQVDLEQINKIVLQQKGVYSFDPDLYVKVGYTSIRTKRALEIVKTKDLELHTDLEKQLFINKFIFSNEDKFIDVLSRYNIDIHDLKDFIFKIYSYKNQGYHNITIRSNKLELLRNHYNINYVEIIINKFLEIFYYHQELIETKKTKKKLL